jgi:hypothetical protein
MNSWTASVMARLSLKEISVLPYKIVGKIYGAKCDTALKRSRLSASYNGQ